MFFYFNFLEGATVQEAMAAASKAYTTDDGKTAVKQVFHDRWENRLGGRR